MDSTKKNTQEGSMRLTGHSYGCNAIFLYNWPWLLELSALTCPHIIKIRSCILSFFLCCLVTERHQSNVPFQNCYQSSPVSTVVARNPGQGTGHGMPPLQVEVWWGVHLFGALIGTSVMAQTNRGRWPRSMTLFYTFLLLVYYIIWLKSGNRK